MRLNYPDIESLKEKPKLPCAELCHVGLLPRPFEPVFLEAFLPQTKTVSIPIQNLYHRPSAVGEHKEMPGEGLCVATHSPSYVANYDMCRRPRACSQALNPMDFVPIAGDT